MPKRHIAQPFITTHAISDKQSVGSRCSAIITLCHVQNYFITILLFLDIFIIKHVFKPFFTLLLSFFGRFLKGFTVKWMVNSLSLAFLFWHSDCPWKWKGSHNNREAVSWRATKVCAKEYQLTVRDSGQDYFLSWCVGSIKNGLDHQKHCFFWPCEVISQQTHSSNPQLVHVVEAA